MKTVVYLSTFKAHSCTISVFFYRHVPVSGTTSVPKKNGADQPRSRYCLARVNTC
jgi:hypothetical protein